MIDVDPEVAVGLDRMVGDDPDGAPDWDDVLSRAGVHESRRRAWTWPLLLPAVGLAIGAAVGVPS
jgi:hypothetical protein